MERSLHPKSSVPRIYLPRHLGGCGLLSFERLHNRVVLATACYLFCARAREDRAAEELSLANDFTRRCQQSITELAPAQLKTHIKAAEISQCMESYNYLEEHGLSQQLTFSFLRSSGLKSETESFIMACQDGVFNTSVYRSRVMGIKLPDAHCRACRQAPETLMHLLSACHTALVQVLLAAGVAVNAADFKGLTPLMTACMFGRTGAAAFLLGMGAANDLADVNGDTALHWAAYKVKPSNRS
nr:unnamed protein product [Callosobruchus chinensis]